MTNHHRAFWAGSSAPTNEEARLQPGFWTDQTSNTRDCAGRLGIQQGNSEADRKRFETLRARCALVGYELTLIAAADDSQVFCVSRWDMSRILTGLTVVEVFADRVGAPS